MPEDNSENGIPLLDVEAQKDGEHDKQYDEPAPLTPKAAAASKRKSFLIWTAINMAATIGIVFTNKAIFNDPAFKLMQTSFASFHFVCTGLTLYVVSRPRIGAFVPKRAGIVEMLPVGLV
jgi:solute carrier family 35 protein E3